MTPQFVVGFLSGKKEDDYTWVMTALNDLLEDSQIPKPWCFITDGTHLLAMLRDLQLDLVPRYRDEEFLYTKLFHACELDCFKPTPTLDGLMTDLRASLFLMNNSKDSQYLATNLDSYYTDRRYKSHPVNSKN
ncbi:hypothetical protein EPUL_006350, partial [Erysiphe pulchra]